MSSTLSKAARQAAETYVDAIQAQARRDRVAAVETGIPTLADRLARAEAQILTARAAVLGLIEAEDDLARVVPALAALLDEARGELVWLGYAPTRVLDQRVPDDDQRAALARARGEV